MGAFLLFDISAKAESFEEIKKKYSSDSYLIGIGIVQSSGDSYKDRRRSEMLAKLEIAKFIKVTVKENTVDLMCEGQGKSFYSDQSECKSQYVSLIEESVEEVLEGSRIVDAGENKTRKIYYTVVVLPKKQAILKVDEAYEDVVEQAKVHLDNAKIAKDDVMEEKETKKAKEKLKKSMAYEGEKLAIEKARQNADDLFRELEQIESK